jgi:hypothetical protein
MAMFMSPSSSGGGGAGGNHGMFGKILKNTTTTTSMFGAIKSNSPSVSAFNVTPAGNTLTVAQYNALYTLQTLYSSNLASKNYTNIPNNPVQYRDILLSLKGVRVTQQHLRVLLQIARNAVSGAVNASTLFAQYAISEIQANTLQARVDQILSDANMISSSNSASGQLSFVQNVTLSPIFNYYILLFGMPAYGVGFDIIKLQYIKSLPIFNQQ